MRVAAAAPANAGTAMSAASKFMADAPDVWCPADPAGLRVQARAYSEESARTDLPQLQRAYACAAFALAQLAECIERFTAAE